MLETATYEVNLYIDGILVGDCRRIAQNLNWSRKRTKVGVDSIDFVLNDVIFDRWCRERNFTINQLLRPMALECRIVRNGVELVGGFLATMPAYVTAAIILLAQARLTYISMLIRRMISIVTTTLAT